MYLCVHRLSPKKKKSTRSVEWASHLGQMKQWPTHEKSKKRAERERERERERETSGEIGDTNVSFGATWSNGRKRCTPVHIPLGAGSPVSLKQSFFVSFLPSHSLATFASRLSLSLSRFVCWWVIKCFHFLSFSLLLVPSLFLTLIVRSVRKVISLFLFVLQLTIVSPAN